MQPAVAVTIERVDHRTDDRPDDQARPGAYAERVHHPATDDGACGAGQPRPGSAEGPLQIGARSAQYQHTDTHRDEGCQGADRDHLPEDTDRKQSADQSGADTRDHGAYAWGVKARVDLRKGFP